MKKTNAKRWIAIGFYLGIGLGLAYLLFLAVALAVMALGTTFYQTFSVVSGLVPGLPWAGPLIVVTVLMVAGILGFYIYTSPQWIILKNRRR